jgi:hypothetical protein
MSADVAKLGLIRPGMSVGLLKAALGEDWKEPGKHTEGHLFHREFGARITAGGSVGEVSFRAPFDLPDPVHGVFMGMESERFLELYPRCSKISDEREEYGWSLFKVELSEALNLIAGVKDDVVRIIEVSDPKAVYPERPYKYADNTLAEAFDLTLADPVRLDRRPEHGWCFGRPPGIDAARWPISPKYGTPLRHAFTLRLPPAYRTLGADYVAISLFVDEQWESLPEIRNSARRSKQLIRGKALTPDTIYGKLSARFKPIGALRFDMEFFDCWYVMVWLREAEFNGPLGSPPVQAGLPGASAPGWLSKSPLEYFGEINLPVTTAERQSKDNFTPGGYGVDQLLAAARPKTGWKNLSAREALEFGWPIEITPREDDPNTGKPAREWEWQNALSGYIPAYSDEGREMGLDRFYDRHAHLGGTMFPIQSYPDFSPFYIEFNEVFGGFNFGDGVAQIDLKEMEVDWAC